MFHKVVWQRMRSMVGFLITTLLQIYTKISVTQYFENRLRFDRTMAMSLWPVFGPPCTSEKTARNAAINFVGADPVRDCASTEPLEFGREVPPWLVYPHILPRILRCTKRWVYRSFRQTYWGKPIQCFRDPYSSISGHLLDRERESIEE